MMKAIRNCRTVHFGFVYFVSMLFLAGSVEAATIYVGNQGSNSLSVIDSASKMVTHTPQ